MAIFGIMTEKKAQQMIADAVAKANREFMTMVASAGKWEMPDVSIYRHQAELLRRSPPVSTAISILAETVGLTPFGVFAKDGKKKTEVDNHPFEALIDKPNDLDSGKELFEASTSSYKITGNTYWWMNKPSEFAPPIEMWFIDSHSIVPVPDEKLFLRGYLYQPGKGIQVPLETWEVVHWRRYNPFNRFVGLSAIEALANVIVGDIEATKWNAELFGKNNARLEGIITFADPIADNEWNKMRAEFRTASDKREQVFLRGVGQGAVNWLRSGTTQKEMEFLDGLKNSQGVIWDALVPGLRSMLDPSATEASSKTGEAVFMKYSVYPMNAKFGDKITQKILPLYGEKLVGEFEDVRMSDRALELQQTAAFERTHTIDEVRQERYEDDPIGDERGKLFVSQVNAQSGGIQEPPPNPFNRDETDPTENDSDIADDMEQDNKEESEEANKAAYLNDLLKWQAKAKQRGPGKAVGYTSTIIPKDVHEAIFTTLPACKSNADIGRVFGQYITAAKAKSNGHTNELQSLKLLLEAAIQAMTSE